MNQFISSLRFLFPSLAYSACAKSCLAENFQSHQVDVIWKKSRERQQALRINRPRHSMGVNHLLRYMEWSCALYLVLREEGLGPEEAGGLIEETNWRAFRDLIQVSYRLSRMKSEDAHKRVRWILDLLFMWVFTRPFQRTVKVEGDGLWFDVNSCPLADYFRSQGVPELTRYAACRLDYRMSEIWGVTLTRTGTIAGGAPLCDFRFDVRARVSGNNT